jgi:CubicO group peptidase (beta-lactamase class C family)
MKTDRFRCLSAVLILCLLTALPALAQKGRVLEPGTPASVGMDGTKLAEGVKLYREAVDRDDIRGAVLMVARHGKIVLLEAVGWKHKGYQLPMEKDTLFRMASNTKPVIATAVLMLEEEGKLRVDDTAARYLPSFNNWRSRTITIAQLLSHTSGFRISEIFYPFDPKDGPPSLRTAVNKFGKEGPEVEPGTSYSYSNPGFNTLGAMIEVVSGLPLETFLKNRIYDPLGMTDTLNHEDSGKLARMATVYRGRAGAQGRIEFQQGFTPDDGPDYPVIRASGGMISTALDYAKFLQMYLNGGRYGDAKILAPESIKKATTAQVKVNERSQYGFGWSISGDGIVSHGGSDGTMAWVDPARDLFALVFTQSPGGRNPTQQFQNLVAESCTVK